MKNKYFALGFLLFSLSNCSIEDEGSKDEILDIAVTETKNSQTPNLWVDKETLHLTWSEETGDTTTLYYTHIDGDKHHTSKVASGTDWFVNWADFSSITSGELEPNQLMTHWLQKSAEGTYDYDIKISKSLDGGYNWLEPYTLHNDGISAEHGFVSLIDYDRLHFFATWLDGRNTKTPDPYNDTKHLPMSIRAGMIHKNDDHSISEYLLDDKVCDCCQTSCTKTEDGVLMAYRDRSDEEIRDIVVQRFDPEGSKVVYRSDDNWKINGCPVNGPALASDGSWSALVWYTAADDPSVNIAYGENASFDKKIKIDNGNPLGRVDIEISKDRAYVSWLEMSDQRAEIRMKIIDLPSNTIINDRLVSYTSPERRSGFPILKLSKEHAYITFTEVLSADHTTIRLKQLEL